MLNAFEKLFHSKHLKIPLVICLAWQMRKTFSVPNFSDAVPELFGYQGRGQGLLWNRLLWQPLPGEWSHLRDLHLYVSIGTGLIMTVVKGRGKGDVISKTEGQARIMGILPSCCYRIYLLFCYLLYGFYRSRAMNLLQYKVNSTHFSLNTRNWTGNWLIVVTVKGPSAEKSNEMCL